MFEPLKFENFEAIDAYADISYRTSESKPIKQRTNQIQIFYNIHGQQTIKVNDTVFETVPGDMVIIPDWSRISISNLLEGAKYNMIQYDPGIFMRNELLSPHLDMAVTNIRKYGSMLLHFPKQSDKKIRSLFDKYDYHSGFGLEVMRFSTLLMFIEHINKLLESVEPPKYEPPKVLIAVDYINRYFDKNIQLEDIADAMKITTRHMGVIFKDFTQITPKQYIDYLRINIAKLTIKTYESSINDAFSATGYNTYSSFYRTFRKFTGETPEEYQKRYNNNPKMFYNEKFLSKISDKVSEDYR